MSRTCICTFLSRPLCLPTSSIFNTNLTFFHVDLEPTHSYTFQALWHEPGPESTPLHLAAACLRPDMVTFLLDNGADRNAKANGRLPLDVTEGIDLFASARVERPADMENVKQLLASPRTVT